MGQLVLFDPERQGHKPVVLVLGGAVLGQDPGHHGRVVLEAGGQLAGASGSPEEALGALGHVRVFLAHRFHPLTLRGSPA